jgi:hypothetical protein
MFYQLKRPLKLTGCVSEIKYNDNFGMTHGEGIDN